MNFGLFMLKWRKKMFTSCSSLLCKIAAGKSFSQQSVLTAPNFHCFKFLQLRLKKNRRKKRCRKNKEKSSDETCWRKKLMEMGVEQKYLKK